MSAPLFPPIVLASSSVYRRELFTRLKLPFTVAASSVDESPLAGEAPRSTATRLAEAKARAVSHAYRHGLIIGSDQVADLEGASIGKPGNYAAALAQLNAMSGRLVTFHTAVCLYNAETGECQADEVPTRVRLRPYTSAQAAHYLKAEPAYDCAGSAKIESLGIALAERVESEDPTALVGLPLIALVTLLKRAGVEVL